VGLFFRSISYFRFRFPGGNDIFFHLSKIRDLNYPYSGEPEEMKFYPAWMHFFYHKMSKSLTRLSDYQIIRIHLVWDFLTAILFWWWSSILYEDIYVRISLTLLFLLTPMLIKQAETFSPRSIGHFWLLISLFFGFFGFPFGLIGVIGIIMTIQSHRLSSQTLIVLCLMLGLFYNIIFLINLIVGLVIGWVFLGNSFQMTLKSHYSFILKYAKGSHYPNRSFKSFIIVPQMIFAIPVSIQIIYFSMIKNGQIKQLIFLNTNLTFIESLELLFALWFVIILLLVLFYPFGEAFRHGSLLTIPSSALLGIFLVRWKLEILLIPILLVQIWIILYILRNSPSNETLIQMGEFIKSYTSEPVLCEGSSRRTIDYFTERVNNTLPSAEIQQEKLFQIMNENKNRVLLLSSPINITSSEEVKMMKEWRLIRIDLQND